MPGQRPVIRTGRLVDGPGLDQHVDDGQHQAVDGQDAGFDPRQQPYGPIPTWTGHPAKGQQRQHGRDHLDDHGGPYREHQDRGAVPVVAERPRRLPGARCPPGPSRRSRRRRAGRARTPPWRPRSRCASERATPWTRLGNSRVPARSSSANWCRRRWRACSAGRSTAG